MQPSRNQHEAFDLCDQGLMRRCYEASHAGAQFLEQAQLPSGEFACYYLNDPDNPHARTLDPSIFPTALTAYNVSFITLESARNVLHRCGNFLLQEMLPGGFWRHWTRTHEYYRFIPPDADDTACASVALACCGLPALHNAPVLTENVDAEGRAYTWIVPRLRSPLQLRFWRAALSTSLLKQTIFFKSYSAGRNDVDGVINANVLFYLGVRPETESIADYLISIVKEGREAECDRWHLSPYNFYYFFSRCIAQNTSRFKDVTPLLIERIMAGVQPDGIYGEHVLDTALAIAALLNLGAAEKISAQAVRRILGTQQPAGSWPAIPAYFGGPDCDRAPKYSAWASEEMTTGFCIEALWRTYRHIEQQEG